MDLVLRIGAREIILWLPWREVEVWGWDLFTEGIESLSIVPRVRWESAGVVVATIAC
jgi:hypothetical protein